jgi:AraC-like DNA-binding protein
VRARRLLAGTDATLASIADQLGFSSAFHFSTIFKRVHGQSPAHWRAARRASSPAAR